MSNNLKTSPIGIDACEGCGMRSQSLFADLNREDLRLIDQMVHEAVVPANTTLFDQGEQGQYLFTVRRGLVKLVRFQTDGSLRIIRMLTTGDIAGLEATVAPEYDSTAITVTETLVCRIPVAVIARLESTSPRLHSQLMRKWHEALRLADDFIADLSSGNARQRLARLLMRIGRDNACLQVSLPSREDIGAMLGITTETASRTVAAFRREGLLDPLDRQGRHYRIDAQALEAVAARVD